MRGIPFVFTIVVWAIASAGTTWAQPAAERLEIVVPRADLKAGTKTIGTVTQGQQFDVVEKQGGYYRINADVNGRQQSGWVYENQIRILPATPAKPAGPPPVEYLVVKSATNVQSGADIIAQALPSEIYRILGGEGAWLEIESATADGLRRGFVSAASGVKVKERDAASLRGGAVPHAASPATVAGDWATGVVTVRAQLALRDPSATLEVASPRSDDVQSKLAVSRDQNAVVIKGHWPALRERLVPGTRSLWIDGDTAGRQPRRHRIDLTSVKLSTAVDSARYDEYPGKQFVLVPVENLLPGATVLVGEVTGKEAVVMRPLETKEPFLPRLVDSYEFEGRTYLRIAVAEVGDRYAGYLYLQVRNADGGLSNSIAVNRRGKTFVRPATTFDDAEPLPVDTATVVPAVELLTVGEAQELFRAAGLGLRAVHYRTMRRLDVTETPTAIVERQAVPPGARRLLGEECLVAVRPANESLAAMAPSFVTDASAAAARSVDVDDALAFVSIESSGLHAAATNREAVDDGGSAKDHVNAPQWLALGNDTGVSLDPSRTSEGDAEAAFLKLLLLGTRNRPDPAAWPGELGRALAQSVTKSEADLRAALVAAKESTDAPFSALAAAIERDLGAESSSESDRSQLLADWKSYARSRRTSGGLDDNGDGRVADDAAAWVVAWLFSHDRYHPRRRTLLAADGGGTPLALLNRPAGDDAAPPKNWFEREHVGLVAPGAASVARTAAISAATASAPPERVAKRGPQQVRVPVVLTELVGVVDGRFRDIGLVTSEPEKLFTTDKVVASEPAQQTWVDSGTIVALSFHRQVPSVVGLAPEQVAPHLSAWRFEHRPRGPADEANVAVEQVPAAGQYLPLDKPIEVEFHAVTPPVVGRLVRDADPFIDAARLKRTAGTKMFAEDKIMEQTPAAGALIDHGEKLQITVHTPVPPVNGLTLAEALVSTEQWDFVPAVPNKYVHQDDRVRGQQPAPGTFIPHRSNLTLDPVKGPVPNLVGMTVADASAQLGEKEHYKPEFLGDLIGSDLVTAQTPVAAVEHERGLVVTLDARVPAPDLTRLPIRDAVEKVVAAPGRLRPVVPDSIGGPDLVYSQDPKPGVSVFPRTTVTIVPGIEIPNLNRVSPEQAVTTLSKLSLKGVVTARPDLETRDFGEIGRLLVTGQNPAPGFYPSRDIDTVALAMGRMVLAVRTVPPSGEFTSWTQLVAAIEAQNLTVSAVVVVGANGGEQRLSLSQFRGRRFGNARIDVLGTIPAGNTSVVAGSGVVLQVFLHEPAAK